jgi:sulfur-carrier protein
VSSPDFLCEINGRTFTEVHREATELHRERKRDIMEIKVLFFGVLAEVTGTSFRSYSEITSLSDLKLRIRDDFPEVDHYSFRISVNNELTDSEPLLKNGDEVAYLPPFAGG